MIREDAMSSWARVILAVDWMARIRCLTARSCAPMLCLPRLLRLRLRRDAPGHRVALDLVLFHRLLRLVGHQHPAAGDLEPAPEVLDRVLERRGGVLVQLPGGADRLVDAGVLAAQRAEELVFEPADVLDRHVVQVARGARPHRDHLALHRRGRVLRLFEQFDQANASRSRYCDSASLSPPATFLIALTCASPPTRDTDRPTLMAGRTPELNRSVSRKICPSVMEMTLVGM